MSASSASLSSRVISAFCAILKISLSPPCASAVGRSTIFLLSGSVAATFPRAILPFGPPLLAAPARPFSSFAPDAPPSRAPLPDCSPPPQPTKSPESRIAASKKSVVDDLLECIGSPSLPSVLPRQTNRKGSQSSTVEHQRATRWLEVSPPHLSHKRIRESGLAC